MTSISNIKIGDVFRVRQVHTEPDKMFPSAYEGSIARVINISTDPGDKFPYLATFDSTPWVEQYFSSDELEPIEEYGEEDDLYI